MRSLLFALLLLSAGTLRAQGALDSLTPRQVREDLDFVARTIERIHVDPWHNVSRARFFTIRDSLTASVVKPVAHEQLFLLVLRLCAAINDSHTYAWPSRLNEETVNDRIPGFPVLIGERSDTEFIVVADLSQDSLLHKGDRIKAINGWTVDSLMRKLYTYFGGPKSERLERINSMSITLWHALGIEAPYQVRYVRNGVESVVQRPGILFKDAMSRRHDYLRQAQRPIPAPGYSFTRLSSDIGFLRVTEFEGNPLTFRRFLLDSFSTLQERPLKGLVIDLRNCTGRNQLFGKYLLDLITEKPFRLHGGTLWKVSQEGRNFYREALPIQRANFDEAAWTRYHAQKDGSVILLGVSAPQAAPNSGSRFTGKVVVLIGPGTTGGGARTAAAIYDYRLAKLAGAPTGVPANEYVDALFSETPQAHIQFGASSKLFVRPNGNRADKKSIQPDIKVVPKLGAANDLTVQAALEWLEKQKPIH